MSYANGRLPDSALKSIPGGRLADYDGCRAAGAWNAGPAKAGLAPLGDASSYRTYAVQEYFYDLYLHHGGNLAARPGTSNHGWAKAVDLAAQWMREWIIDHGHKYGWYWGEATSEWWHVTFNPEWWTGKPEFKALHYGVKNNPARVKRLHKLLRHAGGVLAKRSGKRRRRFRYWRGPWHTKFGKGTERAVKRFQEDHGLKKDGWVGERTWEKLVHIGRIDAD